MKPEKLVMIGIGVLVLFFILRNLHTTTVSYTTTPSTTAVIYKKPVQVPSSSSVYYVNPHYNAYKAQFYN